MNKENINNISGIIASTLRREARPWIIANQIPPSFSVKEISRETRLAPIVIAKNILKERMTLPTNAAVYLADANSQRINGNIAQAIIDSAPAKKSIRESRYQSKAPGGGSVVKSRILDKKLAKTKERLGIGRLKIIIEQTTQDFEQKRKQEIEDKQKQRAIKKYCLRESDISSAQEVLNFLSSMQFTSPVFPEEIKKRLEKSIETREKLTLFIPWGVRPTGEPRLETSILDQLQTLQKRLYEMGINANMLIMAADTYATEINSQVSQEWTNKYFSFIENEARQRTLTFTSWSKIREENFEMYQDMACKLNNNAICNMLDTEIIDDKLTSSARRSGKFTRRGIKQAGFAYIRERIVEGVIIENAFRPIKMSLVAKNKDNLDGPLPRLYLFPPEQQFPWLK